MVYSLLYFSDVNTRVPSTDTINGEASISITSGWIVTDVVDAGSNNQYTTTLTVAQVA